MCRVFTRHPTVLHTRFHMSEDEMRNEFYRQVEACGGTRAFARHARVHPSVVSEALCGGPVGPAILTALGLTRTVTYSSAPPSPEPTPP